MNQRDLLSVLASLPSTLRSVELSDLVFQQGNYADLLADMRAKLDWGGYVAHPKPKVSVWVRPRRSVTWTIWLDKEVNDFLYGDGANPFRASDSTSVTVPKGVGIRKDPFDPGYERPN